jgi:hypothetical protein
MRPKPNLSTMPTVTDAATADAFVVWAVREIGGGFHPDDPPAEYIDGEGRAVFAAAEAALVDAQLDACFRFIDPYEVGLREFEAQQPRGGIHRGLDVEVVRRFS